MILKKEQISNERIYCYLSLHSKTSKVIIGKKTIEMDLSSVKEIESSNEYDIFSNYLLRINKLLSNLKNRDKNYMDSNITIFIDNEMVVKTIKPEGYIIEKPSKEFKKTVDNQRLKAMLGITLQELSNFKNIDLVFENFLLKEVTKMENNTFNYTDKYDKPDLNLDISDSSDIINLPEMDSLNYNEEDLFKGFDLNTDNLFAEKDTNNFIFEDENISIPEYNLEPNKEDLNDIIIEEESFNLDYNDNNFSEDIVFETIDSKDNESFEINKDFLFDTKNEITLENENIIDDSMDHTDDEFIFTNQSEELIYTNDSEEIYSSVKENSTSTNLEKEIEQSITDNDIVYPYIKEVDEYTTPETVTVDTISEVDTKQKYDKKNNNINTKEDVIMDKNYTKNNKTLDIKDEFIQNELIEIKRLLENKIDSYKDKFTELNTKYEEKHSALKDLNLTDETQQLKIFKEFLSCKSNMINLKVLNDACNDIISDIENKIFNIKK